MQYKSLLALLMLTVSLSSSAQYEQMAEMGFNSARSEPNGLDVCAGPIALGRTEQSSFNKGRWPIMCQSHANRPEMLARIEEIKRDISSGKYSDDDLAKMRAGDVWIGAPREAVFFALGKSRNVQKSTTKDGVEEAWRYSNPLDGTAKIVTFVNGLVVRIDER